MARKKSARAKAQAAPVKRIKYTPGRLGAIGAWPDFPVDPPLATQKGKA